MVVFSFGTPGTPPQTKHLASNEIIKAFRNQKHSSQIKNTLTNIKLNMKINCLQSKFI